ncbi:MAG: hypothetical protein HGB12_08255, partial [Bacteroidetes bacterium]|nr:hypothetical protein [Bacteroidota bacterium]
MVLNIGFVQTFAAHRFANWLSNELHADVTIGKVNFTFSLDVVLEDMEIKDLHRNTFFKANSLVLDLKNIYFKKKILSIEKLEIENASVNIFKYRHEKNLNFQFLVDYFSSDTVVSDTSENWKIIVGSIKLKNNHFKYQDQNCIAIGSKLPPGKIDFNNLDLTQINTTIDNFAFIKDSIYVKIIDLSVKDRSGFDLKKLSAYIKISPVGIRLKNLKIETPSTYLSLNLLLEYKAYSDFSDFNEKVKIESYINRSKINLKDISFFVPELKGMDNIINISGEIKGKISNLKIKDFQFLYGKGTYFQGNINISGLPDIKSSYIHANVRNFSLSQNDIKSFNLPNSTGLTNLELPEEVLKLGNVRFKGAFTGFYNDFVAYGDFNTDLGKISTDLTLRTNKLSGKTDYLGKISTNFFNIGSLLSIPEKLGNINMTADVTGSGLDINNAVINIKGNIASLDFHKYNYENIEIAGALARKKFNGSLKINDENIKLDFNGMIDFKNSLPIFKSQAKIENLKLAKLNLIDYSGDSLSSISANIQLDFEGNNIDNLQGTIKAENVSYIYKRDNYLMKNFVFSNTSDDIGNKILKLTSDFVDADISGNFMFKYLYRSSLKFIKEYLPSYSHWIEKKLDSIPEQNFKYLIKLKNTSILSKLVMPDLSVASNTIIKGSYNTNQSLLDLNISSPVVLFKKYKMKDVFLTGKTKQSKININLGCEQFAFSDSLNFNNFTLISITSNDSILYKITWENDFRNSINNSGSISGLLSLNQQPKIEIKFFDVNLLINDMVWNIDAGNKIIIDSNSVAITDLTFKSGEKQIKISGNVSENPADIIHLAFQNFKISDLNILMRKSPVDVDGEVNGYVDVSNIYKSLNIVSNLTITDLFINSDKLGKAVLITGWDEEKKAAKIDVDIFYEGTSGTNNPINIKGYYYPTLKKDNFDFKLSLTNFKLKLLEKYLSGFS